MKKVGLLFVYYIMCITLQNVYAMASAVRGDQWDGLCLPGEEWHEGCTDCKCDRQGRVKCTENIQRFCKDDPCFYPSVWYTETQRCHCTRHHTKICIAFTKQRSMDNLPCSQPRDYFYDDCVHCACTDELTTLCRPLPCKDLASVCVPGEIISEMCRKCTCTDNLYLVCKYTQGCRIESILERMGVVGFLDGIAIIGPVKPSTEGVKAGKCRKDLEYKLPLVTQLLCKMSLIHSCSNDDDCLGRQKCCVKGCSNTCMDPLD